jgi:hypothetical protein
MSGRSAYNKAGSSGRGTSNHSNQGHGRSANRKSSRGGGTGGKQSVPEKKTVDRSSDRNSSLDNKKR